MINVSPQARDNGIPSFYFPKQTKQRHLHLIKIPPRSHYNQHVIKIGKIFHPRTQNDALDLLNNFVITWHVLPLFRSKSRDSNDRPDVDVKSFSEEGHLKENQDNFIQITPT